MEQSMSTHRTAILFTGQGSQHTGMGQALAAHTGSTRPAQCRTLLGYDLFDICSNGPEEALMRSDRAQPAIFLVSFMAWEAFLAGGGSADFLAGHSLGEWTALVAAGVVSFEDAVRTLEARGRFMQEACETSPGAMLALLGKADPASAQALADEAGVHVANLNSPAQIILSGSTEGIAHAEALAADRKMRAMRLPVAGAFHSPLMGPAAEQFAAFLQDISFATPQVPVCCNATGRLHETPDSIRRAMIDQITSPVRWIENIEALAAAGATRYVECGPKPVLTGMVKRIDTAASLYNIHDPASLAETLAVWSSRDQG
jgi:[acyl-carrier-protein] S-malonyltransferase